MEQDEPAIRAAHAAWIEAVNAGDPDRVLGLMTDDAVFLNPGQAAMGRDGFPANFTGAHQRLHLHCTSALDEVAVAGDVAWTRSRDTLSVTPRGGGDTTRLAGDRLTVYRRDADGRWLLARDAHTLAPVGT